MGNCPNFEKTFTPLVQQCVHNQLHGYWLLYDALNVVIQSTLSWKMNIDVKQRCNDFLFVENLSWNLKFLTCGWHQRQSMFCNISFHLHLLLKVIEHIVRFNSRTHVQGTYYVLPIFWSWIKIRLFSLNMTKNHDTNAKKSTPILGTNTF
jgi:hypothetical protein